MLCVAWAHVFCRYVLGSALFWSEEMLRFSLVWFALLSASLIFRQKRHLGIILLVEKFPIAKKEKAS
jgi:TRAP-type C4-dicarboxylate transport system permease small subunit